MLHTKKATTFAVSHKNRHELLCNIVVGTMPTLVAET